MILQATKYGDVIERQNGNLQKPRFLNDDRTFGMFRQWLNRAQIEEPAYSVDSRSRDSWLQWFWKLETLMSGVVNSVVLIDANRGWTITGGRNQVKRWKTKLHNSAEGEGWRYFCRKASLAFWTTDINSIIGTRREFPFATATKVDGEILIQPSPLINLENIDSTQCQLIQRDVEPEELGFKVLSKLKYKDTPLMDWDYMRIVSMPSIEEQYLDLGYCALSRALQFAKLMYAVWQHDQEQLDSKMMKGLLLLNNITDQQWIDSMEAREDRLESLSRNYYGGVQVLANDGGEYAPDAKLVALSQLPAGFDQETMANFLMYGYALCFGYDPREFWPVSGGTLGTGRETGVQAEKATSKGQSDFSLSFQEKLQKEMPDTVHFEFEERNDAGELIVAEVQQAKANVINSMGQLREDENQTFTNEELRQLYAQAGLIPEEWTEQEEEVEVSDEEQARSIPAVRRACEVFWNEPIVRYKYSPIVNQFGEIVNIREDEQILWNSGEEALSPKIWHMGDGWQLTREDIQRYKSQP